MQQNIELKSENKINIRKSHCVTIDDTHWAFVQPDTGSWFLVEKDELDFYKKILLENKIHLLETKKGITKQLYNLGFLELNNESFIPLNFFQIKIIHYSILFLM